VTGIHLLPFILSLCWLAIFVLAAGAAVFTDGFLQGIFIFFAALFAAAPVTIALSLINSLKESQEVEIGDGVIRITKTRPFFALTRSIPFDDILVISVRTCAPADPYLLARFMLHFPPTGPLRAGVLVPTIRHARGEAAAGEFLSDAEKKWLVWLLKAAVYRKTGNCV